MYDGGMGEISHRHPAGLRIGRKAAALTVAACLLASCSTQPSTKESAPNRTASAAPDASAGEEATALPAAPTTEDPAELARQLDRAVSTLRDRGATGSDVRRAGEFQQLAVLQLATASRAFRRTVIGDLSPAAAIATRGDVRAALSLRALNTPQKQLPRWRIVAPPPANELLGHYREAQRRTGVPWTYLAAIHLVESRMGRIRGLSTAGARGPMQFLPATWDLYGAGGDIDDPRDAILAAARLLKANGAPGDMGEALWHYNQSDNYVRAVSQYARTMQRSTYAYRGYWHWRVLYRHTRGTYVLPVGYPDSRPELLPDSR